MLQWGLPQLYRPIFMQPSSMFTVPGFIPFVPTYRPIFTNPFNSINTYPTVNTCPSITNTYNFLNQSTNICTPSSPTFQNNQNTITPQGMRTTARNIVTRATQTGRQIAQRVHNTVSNFAHNMVNTARKYLGYNYHDGSYKRFTQGRDEKWCADFVSYVARECGKSGFNFPAVQGIWDWGVHNGRFHTNAKVGDAIIFKGVDRHGKRVSHTGIVTEIKNGRVYTIEGNASKQVAQRSYDLNDSRITGYVTIA